MLFLRGFFPLKKAIQGRATSENLPPEPSVEGTGHPLPPKFGRVVIMLIDALRADFVFSEQSRMPFTQEMISLNRSYSFLAKAHPPTVTMPRIKAITTGGIPGFIDVVFNMDSKSLQEDNLISQLKFAKKKLVFYGDDTWMKLFPEHFARTDGTTSFFVTDYTEVDNNVTRHIDKELRSSDWDLMILHYLGLDHIGHIAGPSSPLVGPKLLEMDQVVSDIYNAMLRWDQQREAPSLLVLCGDHGMSDAGSHGGASSAETSTPLVFMSPLFEHGGGEEYSKKQVQQIDLVPTLSLLLGLPIPQNSIGIALPDLFSFHAPREMLRALQLNTYQLSQVLAANGHSVDNMWEPQHAHKLHSDWLKSAAVNHNIKNLETMAGKVAKQYILALQKMSSHVTASLSSYDLHAMICGIAVLVQTLYWVSYGLLQLSFESKREDCFDVSVTSVFVVSGAVLLVAVLQLSACSSTVIGGSDILCSVNSAESILFSSVFALQSGVTLASIMFCLNRNILRPHHPPSQLSLAFPSFFQSKTRSLLVIGVLLHVLSLLSSSFVEEEHQTWYFFTSALFVVIFLEKSALFKSHKDSGLHETIAMQEETSENENSPKYIEEKSLDCSNEVRNTSFHKVRENFTRSGAINLNVDKATASGTSNTILYKDLQRPVSTRAETENENPENSHLQWEAIQEVTLKTGVVWHLLVVLLLLGLGRLSRSWNQTGIKWADRPDIGDWLVKPENRTVLSVCYFISLLVIIGFRYNRQNVLTSLVFVIGAANAYVYRTVTGSLQLPWIPNEPITKGIRAARFTYCCVATMMAWNLILFYRASRNSEKRRTFHEYICEVCGSLEGLLSTVLLLEILLQRPHNVTLLAVFVVQEHVLSKLFWKSQEKTWIIIVSSLWMGHAMYFSLGNSNSLASVDISAGYVGLEDFVPGVVGPLTYVATYCGPILWLIAAVLSIVRDARDTNRLQNSLYQACYVITLCQALVLCVYCTLVFGQRYHLFVWSVFSPKLLYEAFKTFLLSMSVVCVLCLARFVVGMNGFNAVKSE
ncbi:hypothetical protein ACROYT_G042986 [Oculina patagonica]